MFKKPSKNFYFNIISVAIWLLIWQVVALAIDNTLILASPWQAILALINLLGSSAFLKSVFGSFYYISLGFLLSAVTAIMLSYLSYKSRFVKQFIAPPLAVFKAVPVASFTILLLISLKHKQTLPTVISFMMSLPIIYENLLAGLNSIDKKMLDMARVFKVSYGKKFTYLYLYRLLPFFATGSKLALGLCWKAGVAAELIGLVQNSIGNELYYAKLYLMMDYVFAWTIVIIALSKAVEYLIVGGLKLLERRLEK